MKGSKIQPTYYQHCEIIYIWDHVFNYVPDDFYFFSYRVLCTCSVPCIWTKQQTCQGKQWTVFWVHCFMVSFSLRFQPLDGHPGCLDCLEIHVLSLLPCKNASDPKQHAFGFMFRPCIKNYHFPEGKEYVNMRITQCISHLSSWKGTKPPSKFWKP